MCSDVEYAAVLARLTAYRNRIKMNQSDFARIFGITQSHFSKQERGITYDALVKLKQTGCDIDYIITGISVKDENIEELYADCSDDNKIEFCKLVLELIAFYSRCDESDNKIIRECGKYMELIIMCQQHDLGVWRSIREVSGKSQKELAEYLHMDVRTYCKLKKGIHCGPDLDTLLGLYHLCGVMPSYVTELSDGIIKGICRIMKNLDDKQKQNVYRSIEYCIE